MCSRISWCIGRSYFSENFREITSNMTDINRDYINIRYLRIVKNLEESTKRSTFYYYLLSSIVTLGSILVPSLISIQDRAFKFNATDSEKTQHSNYIYWTVWIISILVTLSNAFIKLLRFDQTCISRILRLNQLRSEGIMYVTKTDMYAYLSDTERFDKFVTAVEKLKNLQLHQEFTQNNEFVRELRVRPIADDNIITML